MDKFTEQIKKLSENIVNKDQYRDNSDIYSYAVELLFSIADKGLLLLDSSSVKLHRLPTDLVPLFFHFESSGGGFVISTDVKYAFFMQSSENKIFIYGKTKTDERKSSGNTKMQQLFNIDFIENNGKVTFFDSTKKEIKPDEIILLALSWSIN